MVLSPQCLLLTAHKRERFKKDEVKIRCQNLLTLLHNLYTYWSQIGVNWKSIFPPRASNVISLGLHITGSALSALSSYRWF